MSANHRCSVSTSLRSSRLTSADHLSNRFLGYLHQSQTKADEWNRAHPDPHPKRRTRLGWKIKAATKRRLPPQYAKYGPDRSYRERVRTQAAHWKAHSRKHGNLAVALFKTFPTYWYAGFFKVLADMTQLMSPLVVKALIRFSQQGGYILLFRPPLLPSCPSTLSPSPILSSFR